MPIYEIINPSDSCTCEAESLAVAAFCAVLLSPHYGVKNVDDDEDMFFSFFGAVDAFEEQWGKAGEFLDMHEMEIAECLESYCYANAQERRAYKRAMELIDDPAKRQTFRDEWENSRRSSMNAICKAAWKYAERCREVIRAKAGKEPARG